MIVLRRTNNQKTVIEIIKRIVPFHIILVDVLFVVEYNYYATIIVYALICG